MWLSSKAQCLRHGTRSGEHRLAHAASNATVHELDLGGYPSGGPTRRGRLTPTSPRRPLAAGSGLRPKEKFRTLGVPPRARDTLRRHGGDVQSTRGRELARSLPSAVLHLSSVVRREDRA